MKDDPHFLRPGRGVERSRARRKRRAFFIVALFLFFLATAAGLTLLTYNFITNPASFQVRNIVINGAEFADVGDLTATVRELTKGNMLMVDLQQVGAAVGLNPWVREVSVRKLLPDTLQISVTERHPSAFVLLGGELYLTDSSGVLIDRLRPEHPFIGLPIIAGMDDTEPDRLRERLQMAVGMLAELKRSRPAWHSRVSELVVESAERMILRLTDGRSDLIVCERNFVDCLSKYFSVEASIHQRYNQVEYIDLRFDRRIYIKPAPGEQVG